MGWNPASRAAIAIVAIATCALATDPAAAQSGADAAEGPASMFPKGTWTLEFYGNYFHSLLNNDSVASGVAAGGYYFDNRHVFRAEIVGYGLNNSGNDGPDSDDTSAAGGNVGLRYHFYEQ